MESLRAQGSDNIALRERQAKLEKDQQVTTQLADKKVYAFQRPRWEPPKAAARS